MQSGKAAAKVNPAHPWWRSPPRRFSIKTRQHGYYWVNKAVADLKVVKLSGFLAWLSWLLIHLLFIVELRNKIVIFFHWAWAI